MVRVLCNSMHTGQPHAHLILLRASLLSSKVRMFRAELLRLANSYVRHTSPLLYVRHSLPLLRHYFQLLSHLESSDFGLFIYSIYCGALMYADNLSLISNSSSMLQAMLNITQDYANRWRLSFNESKFAVLVFGESPFARACNCPHRSWTLGAHSIPQCDSHCHLGSLCLVSASNLHCISERCSAGRNSFYALNLVGSSFSCLHPFIGTKVQGWFYSYVVISYSMYC